MSGVLVVCSANVCRSPLLAAVLAAGLAQQGGPAGDIDVVSAGVRAADGEAACELAVQAVALDDDASELLAGHRSRSLEAADVEEATLVLTASRAERASLARLVPAARSRTFTIVEAVRLGDLLTEDRRRGRAPRPADGFDPDPLAALVPRLDAARGRLRLEPESDRWRLPRLADRLVPRRGGIDVPDGHVIGGAAHRRTIAEVLADGRRLTALLAAETA